jgi:hypothetical protein
MSWDFKLKNGDLSLGASGQPSKVFNDEKLRQDILKIILTPLGTNPAYPWYGSPINSQVIGQILDDKIIKMEASNAVIYALTNLIRLQKDQERSGQFISPSEAISQILEVLVEKSQFDPRQMNVQVDVATRRANVVSEAFTLST